MKTSKRLSAMAGLCMIHGAANAEVRYVRANAPAGGDGISWRTAFNNPQPALAAAVAGDQIWIAAGNYAPTVANGDRAISFNLVSGVEIYGGFGGDESTLAERDYIANVTTLTGDLNGNDVGDLFDASRNENAYRVVVANVVNAATVLDGVTVTGGQATRSIGGAAGMTIINSSISVRNCTFWRNRANLSAGVGCVGPAAPAFQDCTFTNNQSTFNGGIGGLIVSNMDHVYIHGCAFVDNISVGGGTGLRAQNCVIHLAECLFENNQSSDLSVSGGGGGVYVNTEHPMYATDCLFRGNSGASGGAIATFGGGALTRCTFESNHSGPVGGGAVALQNAFEPMDIVDCVFTGNLSAGTGGAIDAEGGGLSACTLINCLFSGNQAQANGGAILADEGPCSMVNCTFTGNSSADRGGAVYARDSETDIVSSILWANIADTSSGSGDQFDWHPDAVVAVHYSCIQHLDSAIGGLGNVGTDPLFVDADGADNVPGTPDDDLRLGSASPVIDAGDNSALPSEINFDLDGAPRFVDDPATIDTGIGRPPIVDMGCFERQVASPCPADTNDDNAVNVTDLLAVISAWGPCASPPSAADINNDGTINVTDLLAVISAWGACPQVGVTSSIDAGARCADIACIH